MSRPSYDSYAACGFLTLLVNQNNIVGGALCVFQKQRQLWLLLTPQLLLRRRN